MASPFSDETTLNNQQYLSLGVRYVNKRLKKVVEESICFEQIESATADSIYRHIKDMLQNEELPLDYCIGEEPMYLIQYVC